MAMQICMGATIGCSFGAAPSALVPTPRPVLTSSRIAATVLDHVALANIPPFGVCLSPANPAVAAATAAAMGVLTPMPCLPVTPAPWTPGAPTVLMGGAPALDQTSTLACVWGGVISIASPVQATHLVS